MNPLFRSRYNYFVNRSDGVIGYNARTGTFAHLSRQVAETLRSNAVLSEDAPETAALQEMGFLHSGDEYDQIVRLYEGGHSNGILSLTLVPTLACNRSCDYCYQTNYRNEEVMSPETQEATVRYAKSRVLEGWKKVRVTWYGGEPLLAKNILFKLCADLRSEIELAGGELLPMTLVTNGVLLERETAERLKAVGVKTVQVSFDSLIDRSPEFRGIYSRDEDPSIILRNVLSARDLFDLRIRINVTRENEASLPDMLTALRGYGLENSSYLARASDYESEAGAVTDQNGTRHANSRGESAIFPIIQPASGTLSRANFAEIEKTLVLTKPENLRAMSQKLTPKSHFCGATAGVLFVIAPDGGISRCWLSAGSRSETIGNVKYTETRTEDGDVNQQWDRISPFIYAACSTCKVLPLCMGGCSHPRVFMDAKTPPCESVKHQIQFCVDQIGKRLATN